MSRDVDLMRMLLLELESQQRSPPEPLFIEMEGLSRNLSRSALDIREALELLAQLEFIEGPGVYEDAWLFRRLTRRGEALMDAIRNESDWRQVKSVYEPMMQPPR